MTSQFEEQRNTPHRELKREKRSVEIAINSTAQTCRFQQQTHIFTKGVSEWILKLSDDLSI